MEALSRRLPQARTWFNLGDRDLATHLYRTDRLRAGATLTTVSQEIADAWSLGLRLLPVTDDRLQTRVTVVPDGEIGFQEYFVQRHHDVPVTAIRFDGADQARPAPDVLARARSATARRGGWPPRTRSCPSTPSSPSPGCERRWRRARGRPSPSPRSSPGLALKGPADRLLRESGTTPSVVGVARLYAPLVAVLVIDDADAAHAPAVEAEGLRCVVAPTIMHGPAEAAALGEVVLR